MLTNSTLPASVSWTSEMIEILAIVSYCERHPLLFFGTKINSLTSDWQLHHQANSTDFWHSATTQPSREANAKYWWMPIWTWSLAIKSWLPSSIPELVYVDQNLKVWTNLIEFSFFINTVPGFLQIVKGLPFANRYFFGHCCQHCGNYSFSNRLKPEIDILLGSCCSNAASVQSR